MSEMVERVKSVIAAMVDQLKGSPLSGEDKFRLCARAAIRSMREPTEAMKNAAVAEDMEAQVLGDGQIVSQWQVMIDEALK